MTLRPAEEQDREFAYAVRERAFGPVVSRIRPWIEEDERRTHDRRFDTYTYRIIRREDADVGVLVSHVADGAVHLHQLFVLPEHQGQGVGTACLHIVMQEADARGLPVRLRVLEGNSRARALFARLGFTQSGVTATHIRLERAPQPPS